MSSSSRNGRTGGRGIFTKLLPVISLMGGIFVVFIVANRMAVDIRSVATGLPLTSHLVGLGLTSLEIVARGLRMVFLASALGARLTLTTSIFSQFVADGAASVTPSRTGSDPAKAARLRRDRLPWGIIGALLVAELVAEAILLVPVTLVLALLVPRVPAVWGGVGYAVTVVTLGCAALFLAGRLSATPPIWLGRVGVSEVRWSKVRHHAMEFRIQSARLRSIQAPIAVGVAITTLLHIACRIAILPGIVIPIGITVEVGPLVAWPFLLLWGGGLLPPPGGGGLVEAGFALMLAETLPAAVLPTALFWWRVYGFYLTALIGGLMFTRLRPQSSERSEAQPTGSLPEVPVSERVAEAPAPPPNRVEAPALPG